MPVLSDKAGARATSRRISLVLGPIKVAVRTSAGTEPVGPRQTQLHPVPDHHRAVAGFHRS